MKNKEPDPNQEQPTTQHPDDEVPDVEEVRSGSQTAQDREHTIRGGDDQTAPMKEFPS